VIACSFGKDSPVTLALALRAMDELQREGIQVPELHVLTSDTRITTVCSSMSPYLLRFIRVTVFSSSALVSPNGASLIKLYIRLLYLGLPREIRSW